MCLYCSGFCAALHTFPTWIPCLVCNPLHFQELQNSGLQKPQVLMQPKVVSKSQLMALRFNAKSRFIIPALSALLSSLVSSMSTVEAYHDKSRGFCTRWTNCCGWKCHFQSMDLVDKMRLLSTNRFHVKIKRGLVFHICSNDSMLVRHLLKSCSSQPFCHLFVDSSMIQWVEAVSQELYNENKLHTGTAECENNGALWLLELTSCEVHGFMHLEFDSWNVVTS